MALGRVYLKLSGILTGSALILGAVLTLLTELRLSEAVYGVLFTEGILCLLYASAMLVGTPKRRFEYLTRMEYRSDNAKPVEGKPYETYAVLPGLLGVTAIVLGFALEAWSRI